MPDWKVADAAPQRVGVLLFERFSNHCLAGVVEPMRAANSFAGRALYDWQVLSLDGAPVSSSSGLTLTVDGPLPDASGDMLVVMPSYGYADLAKGPAPRLIRAAARRFGTMAGFDTGAWLLAAAGLLDGQPATIHWEVLERFAETFPEVDTRRQRHVIAPGRITCSGALAAFETMAELIGARHGAALRLEVETLFMAPEAVGGAAPTLEGRSRPVARALARMQESLEDPLRIGALAKDVGRSQKDLEARMKAELGATPRAVYRRLRLIAARRLVLDTPMTVAEIALRTGYRDASAMTRAFRAEFGITPRDLRRAG